MQEWPRRLLVVEDEPMVASLLSDVLRSAGFDVLTVTNVVDARVQAEEFDPDAALIDINLGEGPNGLQLAHLLHTTRPDIALVILTKHPDPRTVGADPRDLPPDCGYLRKDMVTDTTYLLDSINAVLTDQSRGVRHDLSGHRPLADLTPKQLDALRMAAMGMSNAAIARERGTSERNVEALLQNAFAALGIVPSPDVNPRVEAVCRYIAAAGLPSRRKAPSP